jgi:hypothetical protein
MSSLLAIYLNDHLAGAVAGHELAKRTLGQNQGTTYEPELERLATEVGEDKDQLERLMADLGIPHTAWKTRVAWVAEKIGRVKLNGSLTGYSPLSRLEEMEALRAGVQGKASMWRSLAEASPSIPKISREKMQALLRRAMDQADRIDRLAERAATEALARR